MVEGGLGAPSPVSMGADVAPLGSERLSLQPFAAEVFKLGEGFKALLSQGTSGLLE